jgi:hypothetical protein
MKRGCCADAGRAATAPTSAARRKRRATRMALSSVLSFWLRDYAKFALTRKSWKIRTSMQDFAG